MNKIIKVRRTHRCDLELEDRKGSKIYIRGDATISQLAEAGVRKLGLSKPGARLGPGWYRVTRQS